MIFPESWGPPPAFSAICVGPEGAPQRIHLRPSSDASNFVQNDSAAEASSVVSKENRTQASVGDKASVLYIVEGSPTASSNALVEKGVYEGGFSIWECTWDLLGFLIRADSKEAIRARELVTGGHVLDLGCGQGPLGIWALQNDASAVVFQDLNEDVLASVTRWNILKNTHDGLRTPAHQHQLFVSSSGASPLAAAPSSEATEPASSVAAKVGAENRTQTDSQAVRSFCLLEGRALCLAAAWKLFPKICCSCQGIVTGLKERKESGTEEEQGSREHRQRETSVGKTQKTADIPGVKFNAILCSEGTYRQEAFEPLANVLEKFLHTDGVALVASKRYYFGVGGGSLAFMAFLCEKYSTKLSVEVAASFRSPNSSNFRDILLVRIKTPPHA